MNKFEDCVNILGVRFANYNGVFDNKNKIYSYANYIDGVKVGDMVVVKVGSELKIVKVVKVVPYDKTCENEEVIMDVTKEVVGFVDMTKYLEKELRAERKKALKTIMDNKIKKIKDQMVYEMFAKDDEEMAKYLEEFKAL